MEKNEIVFVLLVHEEGRCLVRAFPDRSSVKKNLESDIRKDYGENLKGEYSSWMKEDISRMRKAVDNDEGWYDRKGNYFYLMECEIEK